MSNETNKKRAAYRLGHWAEVWASFILLMKGYSILKRRYKTPQGEIDIIIKRGSTIAFVEVKARGDLESAAFAITPRQQKRIEGAAKGFVAQNPRYAEYFCRFDAVLVAPKRWPTHITNAW